MLLDKFSKAPKFISQMIKVYIFSGKYLWLLPCFISYVESLWKKISEENISMHASVARSGCVQGWCNGGGAVNEETAETQLCSSKALASLRTCSTCEMPLDGGCVFHLICHPVFGRSQGVKYPSAHPSVTPAWPWGALQLVGPVALLHSLH